MLKHYSKTEMCDLIRRQALVECDVSAANDLSKGAECIFVKPGHIVIKENATTDDVYLILRGSVDVFVNGAKVARRISGQHVGEMALMLHSRRTATVISVEETVLAKITRGYFLKVAKKYPKLWKHLAIELAERLNQRRRLIREPNNRPFVFIGSSKKHQRVAEAVRVGLKKTRRRNPSMERPRGVSTVPDVYRNADRRGEARRFCHSCLCQR
jgi:CRP/FNR family cyclic AMP-dependent transcriptional regulator